MDDTFPTIKYGHTRFGCGEQYGLQEGKKGFIHVKNIINNMTPYTTTSQTFFSLQIEKTMFKIKNENATWQNSK